MEGRIHAVMTEVVYFSSGLTMKGGWEDACCNDGRGLIYLGAYYEGGRMHAVMTEVG